MAAEPWFAVPPGRYEEAADVCAEAFSAPGADPVAERVFADEPEPGGRALRRRFFRDMTLASVPGGALVLASSPAMEAVAVWLPPGKDHSGFVETDHFVESDFAGSASAAMARMDEALGAINALTADLGSVRQWHLHMLAVRPECEGQGFASRLVRPMLRRADSEGLPCSLVTQHLGNVRKYENWKFGVEKVHPLFGSDDVKFYLMRRQPAGTQDIDQALSN